MPSARKSKWIFFRRLGFFFIHHVTPTPRHQCRSHLNSEKAVASGPKDKRSLSLIDIIIIFWVLITAEKSINLIGLLNCSFIGLFVHLSIVTNFEKLVCILHKNFCIWKNIYFKGFFRNADKIIKPSLTLFGRVAIDLNCKFLFFLKWGPSSMIRLRI